MRSLIVIVVVDETSLEQLVKPIFTFIVSHIVGNSTGLGLICFLKCLVNTLEQNLYNEFENLDKTQLEVQHGNFLRSLIILG